MLRLQSRSALDIGLEAGCSLLAAVAGVALLRQPCIWRVCRHRPATFTHSFSAP